APIPFPHAQPSHKTFRTNQTLAKLMKQNWPILHWINMCTDSRIR
ncbi:unnamed protein product, partial [Discosporangium mesarthrocarpum]